MDKPVRLHKYEPSFMDKHSFDIKIILTILSAMIVVYLLFMITTQTYGYINW